MSWRTELSGNQFAAKSIQEFRSQMVEHLRSVPAIKAADFYKLDHLERTRLTMKWIVHKFPYFQNHWGAIITNNEVVTDVDLSDPAVPTVTMRLVPPPETTNTAGFMHGGALTTFVDNATTWALLAHPVFWKDHPEDIRANVGRIFSEFGVSRNLNLTFLRPVPINEEVFLVTKVQANSVRMIHFTFAIKDKNGKVLVVGSHDKVKTNARAKL